MTTRYYAQLHHDSIGQSAEYDVGDTLDEAKVSADEQLGDGFEDHVICIYDRQGSCHEAVAQRRIGDDGWSDDE